MTFQDNNYPKVLVAIPTYDGKDYILDECVKCVKSFTYPNFEYIIVDNTKDVKYFLKLRRRGYKSELHHVSRGSNSRQALCNAQNFAREKAIKEDFDYLLFVESDLLPPTGTIERLLSHNKAVVGVFYLLGVGKFKQPCVFLREYNPKELCVGTRLIKPEEFTKYYHNGLVRVHGLGLGTTLIRIDIVKRFIFWYDERMDNKHSDVYFYLDCDNNGIPVYLDSDFMVTHFPSDWKNVKDK